MEILILVVLLALLVGVMPAWPYSRSWGYYPSGLGLVLVVIILYFLFQ